MKGDEGKVSNEIVFRVSEMLCPLSLMLISGYQSVIFKNRALI